MSDEETVARDARPAAASPVFVFGSGQPTPASPDSPFTFGAATSSPASPAFSFSAAPTAPAPSRAADDDAAPPTLEALSADVLATILSFFRTAHMKTGRGKILETTTKHDWPPKYEFFLQGKADLASILAFAASSRAAHKVGTSDAVWKLHRVSIEAQLPLADLTAFRVPGPWIPPLEPAEAPPGFVPWTQEDVAARAAVFGGKFYGDPPKPPPAGVTFAEGHDPNVFHAEAPPRRWALQTERGLMVRDGNTSSGFVEPAKWRNGQMTSWSSRDEPPTGPGLVQDLCYPESERRRPSSLRSAVWLPRRLPMSCGGQTFATYDAFNAYAETSWAHHQAGRRREGLDPFPEACVDPRHLIPDAYAAMSDLGRYSALRTYYHFVCDYLEAMFYAYLEEMSTSNNPPKQITKMLDAAADGIMDIADQMRDGHNPDYFISHDEEDDALGNLSSLRYARVCVDDFAIPDFQRYGMRGDAYELIDEGFSRFTPCKGSASFSIFLEKMSGNPKFGIL